MSLEEVGVTNFWKVRGDDISLDFDVYVLGGTMFRPVFRSRGTLTGTF